MNVNRGAILCLGYIFGLFLTCLWGGINDNPTAGEWGLVIGAIAALTGIAAFLLPRHFWQWRSPFWLAVGLVALLAVGYFQVRMPRAQFSPIYTLTQTETNLLKYPLQITGEILNQPRLKADGKSRFWFNANSIETKYDSFATKGKLYVTLTDNQQEFRSGDIVTLKGRLYQPKANPDPRSFDFAQYLQKNNAFLGFTSWETQDLQSTSLNISTIRQRIKNTHQKFLKPQMADLLSSMVLGRQAVNLPDEIYNLWVKSGLAYTIAASGFHVSLLLGTVQWFTKNQSEKNQFFIGIFILAFYILLTGFQPSVLRAALMGSAGLLALVLGRKIKPLSLLVIVATFLLIYNPLWIWDLGFQLSFLATFGLFTTLQPIEKQLDSFPPTIATAIAIPIAASLWTLPLLAWQFNVISTYSIPTSIILSLAITLVSLGGMISGAVGLFVPVIGGAIAYPVGFLLQGMVWFVERVVALPGSNLSVASLHWSQLIIIYGLMLTIWLTDWGKRHSKILGISLFSLFIIFLTITHYVTIQVTILGTKDQPVVIAQSAGKAIIFDGATNGSNQFGLVPFLRQSGINQIESLIAFQSLAEPVDQNPLEKEFKVKQKITIPSDVNAENLQSLGILDLQRFGDIRIQLRQEKPFLLEIQVNRQPFYLLGDRQPGDDPLIALDKGYLITNPKNIDFELWQTLKPQGAIAIGSPQDHFLAPNSIVYWTEEDGAIQWTPQKGLSPVAPEPF